MQCVGRFHLMCLPQVRWGHEGRSHFYWGAIWEGFLVEVTLYQKTLLYERPLPSKGLSALFSSLCP